MGFLSRGQRRRFVKREFERLGWAFDPSNARHRVIERLGMLGGRARIRQGVRAFAEELDLQQRELLAVYDSSARDTKRVLCSMLSLDGSADYLNYAGDPTGGGDYVLCGQDVATSLAAQQSLAYLDDGAGGTIGQVYVTTGGALTVSTKGGTGTQTAATAGSTITAGASFRWVARVSRDGSSRTISVRTSAGLSRVTDSNAAGTIAAHTQVLLGYDGTNYLGGSTCDRAVFTSLSLADEIAFLDGASPDKLSVQPRSFLPLQGDYGDRGTNPVTWTANGSPTLNTTDPAVSVLRSQVAAPECGSMRAGVGTHVGDLSNAQVFTFGLRVRVVGGGSTGYSTLLTLYDGSSDQLSLVTRPNTHGSPNSPYFVANDGTEAPASSSVDLDDGDWHWLIGVSRAVDDREFFLDGASVATSTVSKTITPTHCYVNLSQTDAYDLSGVFVVAGALDATQVAAIAAGADPRSVADLAGYTCSLLAPLGAQFLDDAGTLAYNMAGNASVAGLTVSGSPTHSSSGGARLAPAHGFGWGQAATHEAAGNGHYKIVGDGTSASEIEVPRAVSPGYPYVLLASARAPSDVAVNRVIASLQKDAATPWATIYYQSTNRYPSAYISDGTDTDPMLKATDPTAGTWQVFALRHSADNAYAFDVDGVQVDSGTVDVDNVGFNRLYLLGEGAGQNYNDAIQRIVVARAPSAVQLALILRWAQRGYAGAA